MWLHLRGRSPMPESPGQKDLEASRPDGSPEVSDTTLEQPAPRRRLSRPAPGVILAVALIAGIAAFLLARMVLGGKRQPPPPDAATSPSASASPAAAFTTFTDREAGFSIRFPRSWKKFGTGGDPNVRLIAGPPGSGQELVKVRVERLTSNLPPSFARTREFKEATEQAIGQEVNVLQQRQLELNGLPGWHYLYQFQDKQTGARGLHSHYFLLSGAKIDIIIFQAIPESDFKPLAKEFDRIAESFRSVRRPAPPPGQQSPSPSPPSSPSPAG